MPVSKNSSKLVPTTVSKDELGKLVSEWRPYCLMLAIYFKTFRYGVGPITGISIARLWQLAEYQYHGMFFPWLCPNSLWR